MRSSRVITLFDQPPPSRRGASSLVVSILLHSAAYAWLYFGLSHLPRLRESATRRQYEVRVLRQDDIQLPTKSSSGGAPAHSEAHSAPRTPGPAGQPAPPPAVPPDPTQALSRTRTLVQPEVPPDLKLLQVVPLPLVVKWTPVDNPSKLIVMPSPQETTAALSRPTIKPPNRERVPADINISSTAFKTQTPALPPSTTSPVVAHIPAPVTHVPETASRTSVQPTPAQVVSIPEIQTKQPVAEIPPANSVAHATASTTLAPGHQENATEATNASPSAKQKEIGAGQGSADKNEKAATAGATTAHQEGSPGPGDAPSDSSGTGGDLSVTRITLPKDGQFGVVIVGSALAEQYPETADFWSGRLIYTVYLHVGPGKSWILQYSLPRDAQEAAPGAVTRPDAPWPFAIVRPHLDPDDYSSDAIMVHGYVNPAGRFERLAVVFPAEFEKSKFVLNALQQWQFRPARQNGQIAAVEVLLIIPEETE